MLIRQSLFCVLSILSSSDLGKQALECWDELSSGKLEPFFERIKALFAKIPYKLYAKAKEDFYHANFIILLESMGIKVHPLEMTNLGEIDLVIERPLQIYIKKNLRVDLATEEGAPMLRRTREGSRLPEDQQEDFKKSLEPLLQEAKNGKAVVYLIDAAHFVLDAFLAILSPFQRVFIKMTIVLSRSELVGYSPFLPRSSQDNP